MRNPRPKGEKGLGLIHIIIQDQVSSASLQVFLLFTLMLLLQHSTKLLMFVLCPTKECLLLGNVQHREASRVHCRGRTGFIRSQVRIFTAKINPDHLNCLSIIYLSLSLHYLLYG